MVSSPSVDDLFLLTFALIVIDEIVCTIANALANKSRDKHEEG